MPVLLSRLDRGIQPKVFANQMQSVELMVTATTRPGLSTSGPILPSSARGRRKRVGDQNEPFRVLIQFASHLDLGHTA